jgi:dihydroorotase
MKAPRIEPGRKGNPPLAYVNARLVDPATGLDVLGGLIVSEGTIADIGPHLAREGALSASGAHGIETVDCNGKCLSPGLVDMRTQLREPGEEHKETLASASEAAAAGGVTTMIALPNTKPVIDDSALVESALPTACRRSPTAKCCAVHFPTPTWSASRSSSIPRTRPCRATAR